MPDEIEKLAPDYSVYPDNDTSYGFITRGCIRNCGFCYVPKKEGNIKKVCDIDQIVRHKKVEFLDNNILAYPTHKVILQELIDKKIKCSLNQGLDIRLIDRENSTLLSKLRYMGCYIFAFDDYSFTVSLRDTIGEALRKAGSGRGCFGKCDIEICEAVGNFREKRTCR